MFTWTAGPHFWINAGDVHGCGGSFNYGKRCNRASTAQGFINRVIVTSARHHRCVVRLKGGDPVVFARLDEEMRALDAAGIAYEVVPGITAASAAAANACFTGLAPRSASSASLRLGVSSVAPR